MAYYQAITAALVFSVFLFLLERTILYKKGLYLATVIKVTIKIKVFFAIFQTVTYNV